MTFIDWSDSAGMFALLVEFVADEGNECLADGERRDFLAGLLLELTTIEGGLSAEKTPELIHALKAVRDGVAPEFAGDPVVVHIDDCIAELERVRDDGAA